MLENSIYLNDKSFTKQMDLFILLRVAPNREAEQLQRAQPERSILSVGNQGRSFYIRGQEVVREEG